MNNKLVLTGVGIVAVLALVFSLTIGASTKEVDTAVIKSAQSIYPQLYNQLREEFSKLGAVPSDSFPGERLCVGGVCRYFYRQDFRLGTTTCSFKVPLSRVRRVKLMDFLVDVRTGTSTAQDWVVATSTTGYSALTTTILHGTLTSFGTLSFQGDSATSTAATSYPATGIFGTTTDNGAGDQWVNVGVNLTGNRFLPLTPSTAGSCTAVFQEL
jgi:hypothetical protein